MNDLSNEPLNLEPEMKLLIREEGIDKILSGLHLLKKN